MRLIDADVLKANINTAFWSEIGKIIDSAPTIDADEVVPYSYAEEAHKLYKNATLVPVHGADHCFNGHLGELSEALRKYFMN